METTKEVMNMTVTPKQFDNCKSYFIPTMMFSLMKENMKWLYYSQGEIFAHGIIRQKEYFEIV